MLQRTVLGLIVFLLTSCSLPASAKQPHKVLFEQADRVHFIQQAIPHTHLTMLVPKGWVSDYYQGDIILASSRQNLFYSPDKAFAGVLIHMFVSDGPRAFGPSFDVLKLAEDFVADQSTMVQAPILDDQGERQIVITLYRNEDSRGTLITYLAGFVVEAQQLTVFLAATPEDTETTYLPILEKMLYSIEVIDSLETSDDGATPSPSAPTLHDTGNGMDIC